MKTFEKPHLDECNPLATMELPDGSIDLVTIVYFDVTDKTYTVWSEMEGEVLRKVDPRLIDIMNDAHFTRIPCIGLLN